MVVLSVVGEGSTAAKTEIKVEGKPVALTRGGNPGGLGGGADTSTIPVTFIVPAGASWEVTGEGVKELKYTEVSV
jgi:hypothetical protein